MAKLNITDISNDFTKNPSTGDINILKDGNAIKQSLKNLLLLNKFDKPFNPDIDVGLREVLFENFPDFIRKDIIDKYEPRVKLQEVDVVSSEDQNGLTIQITYGVVNQENLQSQSLQVNLERNR